MLELLISSSVLILVIVILRFLLKNKISARLQYALWLIVLIRLLLPVSLFHSPISVAEAAAPAVAQMEEASYTILYTRQPSQPTLAEPQLTPPQGEGSNPISPARSVFLRDVLRVAWRAGMTLMAGWFLAVNLRMARRLKKNRRLYSDAYPLPVYVTEEIPSPCLFGEVFRPSIYLTPQAAAEEAQARQIITHELTHFRHGDMLWALLRSLCLVIWWFDPLVWLAAALSRQDAELACDEGTIKAIGEEERFNYGRTLLGMAKVGTRPSDLLCGATTMTSVRKTLKERVERIAKAPRTSMILALVVLLAAAAAVGCTYTGKASKPAPALGAEVFRRYYQQIVEDSGGAYVSHVDLDVLDAMACSTVGTAVDTEELRIEVAGAIVSGNTAEIVLRVTAKQLDSLWSVDESTGRKQVYQFGDETALLGSFTLNRSWYELNRTYSYSDTNDALAPNQLELRYRIVTPEPFSAQTYTVPYWVEVPEETEQKPFIIPLVDFGSYEQGRFVPLYEGDRANEGDWNIEIALDPVSETGKQLTLNREIAVGDYRFKMEDVQLTPLACTIRFTCLEDESVTDARSDEIFNAFVDTFVRAPQNTALINKDGTRMSTDCYGGGGGKSYYLILNAHVPTSVDGIAALSVLGENYELGAGTFSGSLAALLPAPSTEPEVIGSYDRAYWEEVERELLSFAQSGRTEIGLNDSFDTAIPEDSVFGPLTLEDYIYGSDAWTFEYNGSALRGDPEAVIIIRDDQGRSLRIASDAQALMIEEADGSITWASCGNAPMDCANMIRHLLPWAHGETPLTEEELAESAAAVQHVYAELGRYSLSGLEPLQERTDTTPPFWAALQSRAPAACFTATAYFGTEEMSADLRYERLYWYGDLPRSMGSESYTLCRSFYAASTALTDVKVGGHDGFITDISGFAGRRLVWYDEEHDLLFSLVASYVKNGQSVGTFSASELIDMAESVALI